MLLCPGKGLVLPTPNVDGISQHIIFLLLALPNNEMSNKSPFAVHKALIGIGGEPKSVKRLRSGDLLIETNSAIQTKSFLLAKSFLNSPLIVTPHKSLNSCRGVISEPDLMSTSESEILDGFSDQGVIQVRRITIKKDNTNIPTKHLILTFNSPKLPSTIKAGYLNCKICPYIPNPLRCFKCQSLEQKCVNCSEPHSSDSKLCPKWENEKEIQTIKTNRNIPYLEARKLIAPQLSQTYAQITKPLLLPVQHKQMKIKCPPLQLLKPLSSVSQSNAAPSVSTLSSTTQANLLPSASSIKLTTQIESRLPEPISASAPDNSLNTSSSSAKTCPVPTTSNKFAALQPSVLQLLHPIANFVINTSKAPQM
ncbi:uncharacterized protein TNCV_560881 [Trichonephila clavipes]|nr:uncharacterized protein TNCV_560881 [Trichonephila clavipes]